MRFFGRLAISRGNRHPARRGQIAILETAPLPWLGTSKTFRRAAPSFLSRNPASEKGVVGFFFGDRG